MSLCSWQSGRFRTSNCPRCLLDAHGQSVCYSLFSKRLPVTLLSLYGVFEPCFKSQECGKMFVILLNLLHELEKSPYHQVEMSNACTAYSQCDSRHLHCLALCQSGSDAINQAWLYNSRLLPTSCNRRLNRTRVRRTFYADDRGEVDHQHTQCAVVIIVTQRLGWHVAVSFTIIMYKIARIHNFTSTGIGFFVWIAVKVQGVGNDGVFNVVRHRVVALKEFLRFSTHRREGVSWSKCKESWARQRRKRWGTTYGRRESVRRKGRER